MLLERLIARVPSATVLGKARLSEYTLAWHKAGSDGSGKCSIVKTSKRESNVWGVLYEIDPAEKLNLDRIEGLGYGYDEITVQLEINRETLSACTYIATDIAPSLKPFQWYKNFVVYGAIQNKLPQHYITILKTTESIKDKDKKRQLESRNILKNVLKDL